MTTQRNKRRETQQPSQRHEQPNMQSSSSLAHPPGLRFVPTDAELIHYYLKPVSRDNNKSWPNLPIYHANIYESNPQQLSEKYKKGNLTEWFFISERTKIKRNGTNQKRGDHNGGYWHSKALTKEIKAKQGIIGYKTTLNYRIGKQPNGERTNWLMQEYWLESSDRNTNTTVDYAICKIYLNPTAKKNMQEEDVEDLEEEVVQADNVENQQPQFWPTELDSHQPQLHDIAYKEPLQPQPLNTIYHHQSHNTESEHQELHQPQPLSTIHHHHHQSERHDQESPQPQPLDTIIPHQSHFHDIEYQEPHQSQPFDTIIHHQSRQLQIWQATLGSHKTQPHEMAYHEPQPLDTVHNQLAQFWPTSLDSYPPHCHDIQYLQRQPLDAIEYQYLHQSGPLTTYENMIESSTQDKSNGDNKKLDHALCNNLTSMGVKRKAEEEEEEKRKRKRKRKEEEEEEEEEGVEASKEEHKQPINSHHIIDDDDSFFTGFFDTHLLDTDIESIDSCCLKKSSDKD